MRSLASELEFRYRTMCVAAVTEEFLVTQGHLLIVVLAGTIIRQSFGSREEGTHESTGLVEVAIVPRSAMRFWKMQLP
jgi:hypothetical protein